MILTSDQVEAAGNGEAVRLRDNGVELVVLRADIYDRLQYAIDAGTKDDPRHAYPSILRAWDEGENPQDYEDYRQDL